MSAITFTLDFTGTPDPDDILAARHIVAAENFRRAQLDPPQAPLPSANGAQLKASYLSVLLAIVTAAHQSYISQAKSPAALTFLFTEAQLEQIRSQLAMRRNNGESAESIVTDVAA